MLFENVKNNKDALRLNVNVFNILTHTSIGALGYPMDFFAIENPAERDRERELWAAYVREMSEFYFDLFVDYIQALIHQGTYTVDDALVFNKVMGKYFGK
jgi:hypothetical protein